MLVLQRTFISVLLIFPFIQYLLIFTKDTIREVETYIRLLWSDPALFLTSKEYKWWAIQKKIFHMASRSPFYLDHWTIFQLWFFYMMHYSDPEKMNISLLVTNSSVNYFMNYSNVIFFQVWSKKRQNPPNHLGLLHVKSQ